MPDYSQELEVFYGNIYLGFLTLVAPIAILVLTVGVLLSGVLYIFWKKIPFYLIFVFTVAFSLIGAVAGEIAGASMEAIVGAALTAILALVSTLLAYLFGQASLRVWRPVIPIAIIALLISTLCGLVIGGSWRTRNMNEKQRIELKIFEHEQVVVPAWREERLLTVRKCVAERNYAKAIEDCDAAPPQ